MTHEINYNIFAIHLSLHERKKRINFLLFITHATM